MRIAPTVATRVNWSDNAEGDDDDDGVRNDADGSGLGDMAGAKTMLVHGIAMVMMRVRTRMVAMMVNGDRRGH